MTTSSRAALQRILYTLSILSTAVPLGAQPWRPDLGDGRYRNPIIFADYSDPDVLRVGDDFYMTASSFGHVPGLPILHSRDLVNWTLVGHAIQHLPADSAGPQHGNAVWAPSLRFHDGWFLVYYGDPDRGIYVVRARDVRGPWEAPRLVRAAKGWIDPAPFWDDDGQAYLVHAFARSRAGIKHRLHVSRLSADGLTLLGSDSLVFMDSTRHPTMEGPKLYKRDGWYYVFAPAGGVPTGWQTVLRARTPFGPYEDRIVMAQGPTPVNGPHQGGWVHLASGEDWFVHFQDRGAYGRIVHLQPMTWKDGWPVIGEDPDGDGTGQPVLVHRKPDVGRTYASAAPATSDEFSARTLGLQWQWQANPEPGWHSLDAHPGALRLFARPLAGVSLWSAGNLLLQKLPAPTFTATTRLVPHGAGTFGLTVFGLDDAYLAVRRADAGWEVVHALGHDLDRGSAAETIDARAPVRAGPVWLRVQVDSVARDSARCTFAYSTDGARFTPLGAPSMAREGKWVGAKVGLFAVGADTAAYVDADWFRVR
ncbi:MAG: glycoside hydrolase 43 family protein [Gemmatirosa sp.]|nr:glycoside hydrolase 43 family protein [Gemmatirosa sp.]